MIARPAIKWTANRLDDFKRELKSDPFVFGFAHPSPSIIHAFISDDLFGSEFHLPDHSINISYTHALIGIIDGFSCVWGKGSLSLYKVPFYVFLASFFPNLFLFSRVWCLRGRNFDSFDFFRAITSVTWLIEKVEGQFHLFLLCPLTLIASNRFSTQSAPAHPFPFRDPDSGSVSPKRNGIWQQHPDRR